MNRCLPMDSVQYLFLCSSHLCGCMHGAENSPDGTRGFKISQQQFTPCYDSERLPMIYRRGVQRFSYPCFNILPSCDDKCKRGLGMRLPPCYQERGMSQCDLVQSRSRAFWSCNACQESRARVWVYTRTVSVLNNPFTLVSVTTTHDCISGPT